MRLAFALYRYTPFGGLERSFHAIATAAARAGHDVHVFTRSWTGERPVELEIEELPVGAWTNVGRDRAFAAALGRRLRAHAFDALVGFNRLPDLDVFYAADPCLAAAAPRTGSARWAERWTARHRTRLAWERAAAAPRARTHLLLLSERERERFQSAHGTPPERLHVLPPGLAPGFLEPVPAADDQRARLGIPAGARVVLAIGSDFHRKGLDRTLAALAGLAPALRARTWLVVVGAGRRQAFQRRANALGLGQQVRFLGGLDDPLPAYRVADLLAHPAREEPGGTVVIEAASQGLAVVASAAVGFAELLAARGAARVLPEPFDAAALELALTELLTDEDRRSALASAGRTAAAGWPLATRTQCALAVIERAAHERRTPAGARS